MIKQGNIGSRMLAFSDLAMVSAGQSAALSSGANNSKSAEIEMEHTLETINSNSIIEQLSSECLLEEARCLADSCRYDDASKADLFPRSELRRLFKAGFARAPLPLKFGGAGLGTDPGTHWHLLQTLREIGRANLSLARIYEGHINSIVLIFAFGSESQQEEVAQACISEKLFALWNTDGSQPTRLTEDSDGKWILNGDKAFASGVGHADYFVLTADKPGVGSQMCLIEAARTQVRINDSSWHPLGMIGSCSFGASFDHIVLPQAVFIGQPGDYYRPPLFLGGAIRASAIHLGGAEALFRYLQDYSKVLGRTANPLLRRRAALIFANVVSGRAWLDRAAKAAETNLFVEVSIAEAAEMNFTANIVRVAIEKVCADVIQLVVESVGARGLNQPYRFAEVIRDLTMLLRQPDPDGCVTEAGRYILEDLNDQILDR